MTKFRVPYDNGKVALLEQRSIVQLYLESDLAVVISDDDFAWLEDYEQYMEGVYTLSDITVGWGDHRVVRCLKQYEPEFDIVIPEDLTWATVKANDSLFMSMVVRSTTGGVYVKNTTDSGGYLLPNAWKIIELYPDIPTEIPNNK